MSVRELVMTAVSTDATLLTSIKAFWSTNAVDTPTAEERPFLILRWEELLRGHSDGRVGAGTQNLTVWVHDSSEDYSVIDATLERVKTVLGNLIGRAGSDGWTLMQADWQSDSADLIDDGFHTLTRYSRYVIAQGWR